MATVAKNFGGWSDQSNGKKYDQLAGIISNGGSLNPNQQRAYATLAAVNAKHGNQQQKASYKTAVAQAPMNAVGGYLSPTNNPTFSDFLKQNGGTMQAGSSASPTAITSQGQLSNPYTTEQYGRDTGRADWNMGQALRPLSAETMAQQPGYQFTLQQGQQALDRTAAARGGVLGGGQLKAQTQYATDLANTHFNDYYNQDMQNRQMDLNNYYQQIGVNNTNNQNALNNYQGWANNQQQWRNDYGNLLSGQVGNGQSAAGGLAGMLQNNAQTMADAYTGNGSAQAQNGWMGSLAKTQAGSGLVGLADKVPQMVDKVKGWF